MNKNQLKATNNWSSARAQCLKCGTLVSTTITTQFIGYYEGKNYVEKSYQATEETYHYLGMRWDFTLVNESFSFQINTRYGSRDISYSAGEVTRRAYAPQDF